MRKIQKNSSKKGFTLLETLIYFGMLAVVMTTVIGFAFQLVEVGHKGANLSEMQNNMTMATSHITRSIQEAVAVNDAASVLDTDIGTLSLEMTQPSLDPTVYYISDGGLYVRQNSNPAQKINSDKVTCTQFRFQKIDGGKAPDQVVVNITCETSGEGQPVGFIERSLQTTVSLRV